MNHEVFDDSVEFRAFVSKSFGSGGESVKVFDRFRDSLAEQADLDGTSSVAPDCDIEENLDLFTSVYSLLSIVWGLSYLVSDEWSLLGVVGKCTGQESG